MHLTAGNVIILLVMELMSPAGSKEAFLAAVKGGTDAVYIGLKDFNARKKAKNFNLYDLMVLTDYARKKKVKLYLTFNSLVKQHELNEAYNLLIKISSISPDALIVQDIGIARIIKEYFPHMKLHASTQLAVHNSQGVKELASLGFSRVILSRELSLAEIQLISNKSPIELEVFCHGALCFSLSGMCLFSSYLGGHSGNRGLCTQPCRRKWAYDGKENYVFSPRDLQSAVLVQEFKKIGISAIKIEGRMRSSEYVFKATSAYRLLLDATGENLKSAETEASGLLDNDWSREKSTCLLSGVDRNLFNPARPSTMGRIIGKTLKSEGPLLKVNLQSALNAGDRIRVENADDEQPSSFKVHEIALAGNTASIVITQSVNIPAGLAVYKSGDASWDEKPLSKEIDGVFNEFDISSFQQNRNKSPHSLPNQWPAEKQAAIRQEKLFIRLDDIGWFHILSGEKEITPVFYLSCDNINKIRKPEEMLAANDSVIMELPPFIGQRELENYRKTIDRLIILGMKRWVINNISHFSFFKEFTVEIIAGHMLYTLNTAAARQWKDCGAAYFTFSWEDDILNLKGLCRAGIGSRLIVYLYGHPVIARSRMMTKEMCIDSLLSSRDGKEFRMKLNSGQVVLIPSKPQALFNFRKKLREFGVAGFGIDLSFIEPDEKFWKEVKGFYDRYENPLKSNKFNFKYGLK